jgi:hypothetical protein
MSKLPTWTGFGHLGLFHYWAPYAQAGVQFQGPGDQKPQGKAGLFPINLSLKFSEAVTLAGSAGVVGNLDLSTGKGQWGFQTTLNLNVLFGVPVRR